MIGVDWTKLAKKCGKIESINISKPSIVKDGNLITIYQHPGAGLLASSSSPCIIYGKQHGACMHGKIVQSFYGKMCQSLPDRSKNKSVIEINILYDIISKVLRNSIDLLLTLRAKIELLFSSFSSMFIISCFMIRMHMPKLFT